MEEQPEVWRSRREHGKQVETAPPLERLTTAGHQSDNYGVSYLAHVSVPDQSIACAASTIAPHSVRILYFGSLPPLMGVSGEEPRYQSRVSICTTVSAAVDTVTASWRRGEWSGGGIDIRLREMETHVRESNKKSLGRSQKSLEISESLCSHSMTSFRRLDIIDGVLKCWNAHAKVWVRSSCRLPTRNEPHLTLSLDMG